MVILEISKCHILFSNLVLSEFIEATHMEASSHKFDFLMFLLVFLVFFFLVVCFFFALVPRMKNVLCVDGALVRYMSLRVGVKFFLLIIHKTFMSHTPVLCDSVCLLYPFEQN